MAVLCSSLESLHMYRLKPDAKRHAESRGHVGGLDYITGLPPDNDGNTAVLGLVVASRTAGQSVAWYQPVKSLVLLSLRWRLSACVYDV